MTKLRISVVQYLNTAPLVRGFTHGALRGKYDLSFTVPSQCAEALRTGAADVAIIPAIEYQRIVSQGVPLTVLPGLAIASKERVRSLLLISRVPIRQARRIALDPSSRSTQALVKILAAKHWQIAPEFFEPAAPVENGLDTMLGDADAALIIGDAALRIAIAAEAQPSPFHIYDVVTEWRHLTERPAVLAIWAARNDSFVKNVVPADITSEFLASCDFGVRQIPQIAAEAAHEMQLPEKDLRLYLEKNIDYTLDQENLEGLQRFYALSSNLGITGPLQPLAIATAPHSSMQYIDQVVAQKHG